MGESGDVRSTGLDDSDSGSGTEGSAESVLTPGTADPDAAGSGLDVDVDHYDYDLEPASLGDLGPAEATDPDGVPVVESDADADAERTGADRERATPDIL